MKKREEKKMRSLYAIIISYYMRFEFLVTPAVKKNSVFIVKVQAMYMV